jgi:hypothetical protein
MLYDLRMDETPKRNQTPVTPPAVGPATTTMIFLDIPNWVLDDLRSGDAEKIRVASYWCGGAVEAAGSRVQELYGQG